jgi:glutathione S-transferase
MASPKIILYTNHGCPWAHRAHIALAELSLPFTEEIIDLSVPRTAEYLTINPRGLVPSLSYNGEIITESAIVAQFLADAHPSHLVKTSSEPGGALQRARISFFVDAFISKVNPQFWAGLRADNEEERNKAGQTLVDAVKKELEPLLADAAPFFGGTSKLTLAEVIPISLSCDVLCQFGLIFRRIQCVNSCILNTEGLTYQPTGPTRILPPPYLQLPILRSSRFQPLVSL